MGRRKRNKLRSTSYEPPFKPLPTKLEPPDDEPGLPSIHKVKADGMPRLAQNKVVPRINETKASSMSHQLLQNIDLTLHAEGIRPIFEEDTFLQLTRMVNVARSPNRFDSRKQFASYITEGALLNVNRVISGVIGIPQGEYMVYRITPEKAMLMPTASVTMQETDFARTPSAYEVFTKNLLGCWDKLERTLSEDNPPPNVPSHGDWEKELPGGGGKKERIQQSTSKYPRNQRVKGAIEASGKDQEDLANACSVHPSEISRITAQSGKGARKPSLDLAMCVARQTGQDVETLFTKSEGPPSKGKRKKTSGSGGGRNKTYRKGTPRK